MKYSSLFDLWKKSCEEFSHKIAFSDNEEKINITYKQAFRRLCFLTEKFEQFGLNRFDKVCLFAVNSPQWLILEQAIITLGSICVSKTSEIDIKELDYVFSNSDSVALITDNADIVNYFHKTKANFFNSMKFVLYVGQDKKLSFDFNNFYNIDDILSQLNEKTIIKTDWEEVPSDIAYINYTSGTSSIPKGAMLPNEGMAYVVEQLQLFNDIKPDNTFIVTFPLSSAGGKSFNLLCFSCGCRIMYTPYKEFYKVIDKYKPEYLHCAPKIMQTMHSMLMTEVKNKGFLFEQIFKLCFGLSSLILNFERKFLYKNKLLFLSSFIESIKNIIDKFVYKQIRNTLLKDEIVVFVGSAHLAKPLEDYFEIMNIPLVQHYGLTETTGLAVSNTRRSQQRKPYTVGMAFEGTTIKIVNPETFEELPAGEVGLITLGGIEITKGYYKNPEATEKALLPNGFLNTADLGYVDKEGYLVVLSRYDDVIVMSNGYNVYTPLLENEAKDSEFVNQLVIAGHGKPYLISLIVLNIDMYNNWCVQNNKKQVNPNYNEEFKEFLISHLNEKIKRKNEYRYYEKIKKVYFLKDEFTVDNGMLTGTLKVKYRKVCNTYQKEIDSLYEGI